MYKNINISKVPSGIGSHLEVKFLKFKESKSIGVPWNTSNRYICSLPMFANNSRPSDEKVAYVEVKLSRLQGTL